MLQNMIDTAQPDTNIDLQPTRSTNFSTDRVTDAQRAHELQEARRQYIEYHYSDRGIAQAASPNTFMLTDDATSLDPNYMRFFEPAAGQVTDVLPPKTELERQIESLTAEQQIEVVAGIGQYMVAMRRFKLDSQQAITPSHSLNGSMSLMQKMQKLITGAPLIKQQHKITTERQLIEHEDVIGRELFGPIPDGHRRDFFCLDEHTWVWHEEWMDANSRPQTSTTRYEVQPNGILKVQSGRVYKYIEGEELKNLTVAVRLYYERTMREVYKSDPLTGQSLETAPVTM